MPKFLVFYAKRASVRRTLVDASTRIRLDGVWQDDRLRSCNSLLSQNIKYNIQEYKNIKTWGRSGKYCCCCTASLLERVDLKKPLEATWAIWGWGKSSKSKTKWNNSMPTWRPSSHLLHLVALIDQHALARLHARQRAEARVDVYEPLAQVLHCDSLKMFRKHIKTQREEC